MTQNKSTHPETPKKDMQVFSRPTFDRIAKYIMCEDESIRVDILKAFTGIKSLCSARQLDEHYNPFDPYSSLRKLLHSQSFKSLFENIKSCSKLDLMVDGETKNQFTDDLKSLSHLYGDLLHTFPDEKYRSTVDFLCETDYGYLTIEFQVAKQDFWDKRALGYIANIYGRQLRPGKDYQQIQDVIGINLIGDGSTPYWSDGKFIRNYMFTDKENPRNTIPALRLIQYSLGDVDLNHPIFKENDHLRQWVEFFKSAHEKERIPARLDEPVKRAYELIRVDVLKKSHPDLLTASADFFSGLTEHDEAVRQKGKREGKEEGIAEGMAKGKEEERKEVIMNMINQKFGDDLIMQITKISKEELEKYRKRLK